MATNKFKWKPIYTAVLLGNILYIVVFYLIMKRFTF